MIIKVAIYLFLTFTRRTAGNEYKDNAQYRHLHIL